MFNIGENISQSSFLVQKFGDEGFTGYYFFVPDVGLAKVPLMRVDDRNTASNLHIP